MYGFGNASPLKSPSRQQQQEKNRSNSGHQISHTQSQNQASHHHHSSSTPSPQLAMALAAVAQYSPLNGLSHNETPQPSDEVSGSVTGEEKSPMTPGGKSTALSRSGNNNSNSDASQNKNIGDWPTSPGLNGSFSSNHMLSQVAVAAHARLLSSLAAAVRSSGSTGSSTCSSVGSPLGMPHSGASAPSIHGGAASHVPAVSSSTGQYRPNSGSNHSVVSTNPFDPTSPHSPLLASMQQAYNQASGFGLSSDFQFNSLNRNSNGALPLSPPGQAQQSFLSPVSPASSSGGRLSSSHHQLCNNSYPSSFYGSNGGVSGQGINHPHMSSGNSNNNSQSNHASPHPKNNHVHRSQHQRSGSGGTGKAKSSSDVSTGSGRSRETPLRPRSPNRPHIKKPLNAFMLYMKEMRPKVQDECTLKESAAINQILGKKWHELSKDEQAKYYEMARKEKEIHSKMFPGWSARDNYAMHSKRKKRRKLMAAVASIGQGGRHQGSSKQAQPSNHRPGQHGSDTPHSLNGSKSGQSSTAFHDLSLGEQMRNGMGIFEQEAMATGQAHPMHELNSFQHRFGSLGAAPHLTSHVSSSSCNMELLGAEERSGLGGLNLATSHEQSGGNTSGMHRSSMSGSIQPSTPTSSCPTTNHRSGAGEADCGSGISFNSLLAAGCLAAGLQGTSTVTSAGSGLQQPRSHSPALQPSSSSHSGGTPSTDTAATNCARDASPPCNAMGGSGVSSDLGHPKKCRARFGLEQQDRWCKPCRRKKKCIRYFTDGEYEEALKYDQLSRDTPTPTGPLPTLGNTSLLSSDSKTPTTSSALHRYDCDSLTEPDTKLPDEDCQLFSRESVNANDAFISLASLGSPSNMQHPDTHGNGSSKLLHSAVRLIDSTKQNEVASCMLARGVDEKPPKFSNTTTTTSSMQLI